MRFFTSAKDLGEWIKHQGTADVAAQLINSVIGEGKEQDIFETCRNILKGDENASNVLFGILAKYNITELQTREGKMKEKLVKEAQMMRQDSVYGNMEMRVCPKLPFSAGKRLISTYNCRHGCLDSLVFDDDPNKVYCAEALWRRHVMDKFSREFKDKEGKWVGGYINQRFQVFHDDGGNQMQLAHGEKTRLPRPHQYSTESRLSEARGEELTFHTASSNKFVKLASVEKDTTTDKVYEMYSDMIEMREAGLSDEDILTKVAEHYNASINKVASIYKAAKSSVQKHDKIVYATNNLKKNASVGFTVGSSWVTANDVDVVEVDNNLNDLPNKGYTLRPNTSVTVINVGLNGVPVFQITASDVQGGTGVICRAKNSSDLSNACFICQDDAEAGNIQEAADFGGLNEEKDNFPVETVETVKTV